MKFFFRLLAVAVVACYVDATNHTETDIQDPCAICDCDITTNPTRKVLISCGHASSLNTFNFFDKGITDVNADAFAFNTAMTNL